MRNFEQKGFLRIQHILALLLTSAFFHSARAEDGYRLWLRYDPITDVALRQHYAAAITELVVPNTRPSLNAAREELIAGLRGLLSVEIPIVPEPTRDGSLLVGTATDSPALAKLVSESDLHAAGEEGYILRGVTVEGHPRLLLLANRDIGVLYGAFALLRHLQTQQPIDQLNVISAPKIQRRLLNHWDNLNGSVERGYAGASLWDWQSLPDHVSPRYRDYARANASIGINGAVLNNVNADAAILTAPYLRKVAAIAGELRPYGMRVYLTARFSTPIEIGGLHTADPLDPAVRQWWKDKVNEIYGLIPDFGGFLVKANSEGQPGPQTYGRTHSDGANLLGDSLAPHGGIVMWRAFVYAGDSHQDRAKQAYIEFVPLDGKFRDNVVLQVKNGPIDFMPREPFHPLFGAMPATTLAAELQITQEYLGQSSEVAFLAPMWKECLDSDTFRPAAGATVARVIEGQVSGRSLSVIAGVANTGTDRNWTRHPLAAANWYAFGRLAWNPDLTSAAIAEAWTRATFSNDPTVVRSIGTILLQSHETVVNYSMPLGLHHIMAEGEHFGPGPWVSGHGMTSSDYFHRADADGIGFDRTRSGSDAVSLYAAPVAAKWGNPATCPDELLLWFHHVPWGYRMPSGSSLWDELALHYQHGVEAVDSWQHSWRTLEPLVDHERFSLVQALLARQEADAKQWRDACLLYFQQFSKRPLPPGVEAPAHPLDYYRGVQGHPVPGGPSTK